jgi:hypothetical protein
MAPEVFFRAEDSTQDQDPRKEADAPVEEGSEETIVDGKVVKLDKISNGGAKDSGPSAKQKIEAGLRGEPGEGGGGELQRHGERSIFISWGGEIRPLVLEHGDR